MIDVWLVVSNSVWIAGLSVVLAAVSWASWKASVERAEGARLRTVLARPGVRLVWALGMALFCAGMAATGRAWWERALWGALAVAFAVYALLPQTRS
jgi:hypothetical protein